MAAQSSSPSSSPKTELAAEQKLQKLREIFADGPGLGRVGLEKIMAELEAAIRSQQKVSTAGRTGLRQGKVSELTMITKFAPGGAKRLRALLDTLGNNFQGADKVGTVHDMRFVFLDNDTKLLFATAYDGDWDPISTTSPRKFPMRSTLCSASWKVTRDMHNPADQGLDCKQPDFGRCLVCRQSEPHRGRDPEARKGRQGGR